MMKHVLLAPLLWTTMAVPAVADRIPLAELSRYFNGFATAASTFTQVNPDGSLSTGQLYIHRPGRVRFEYDPPEESLVLAAGGTVAIFDPKSNQGPSQYPLSRTPLNLILAREVDLTRDQMVVAHDSDADTTTVVARDPERPEHGTIEMVFTDDPVELRQWVITDDVGETTTVILDELELGTDLARGMFSIRREINSRDTSTGARR